MNMLKKAKRVLALLLAAVMLLSLAACGDNSNTPSGDDPDVGGNETVDTERTQLYVFNFAGGYGVEWLKLVKERYEELHKDDVYEEGKKGIQIVINNEKNLATELEDQILNNRDEIYFTESAYYYTLLSKGVLGDITEAVTGDMSKYGDAAGSTLLDKMYEGQKTYLGVEENGETKYYAYPHYASYTSLMYNVDLFEKEKYYFAKNVENPQSIEDYFIVRSTDERSAGPDGEYGTADDGLPATFEEFFILCSYIASNGQTPVNWNGSHRDTYLGNLLQAMVANVDGLDQTMLNFTMNGTATNLGTATADGFVADGQDTTITAANGYEMLRSKGRYYALDFLSQLVSNKTYYNELGFNSSYSHLNAQEDFLYAGNDGGITAPIAMIVEGSWWENEAEATYKDMVDSMGDNFAKENRNFAIMPLPKVSDEDVGKNTLCENSYSLCFMKANIADWKKPIALDFIMFANSDEALAEFTQVTNTPKALKYEMTAEQLSSMTNFGRSVLELQKNSDIVFPYSSEPFYINNAGALAMVDMWHSAIGGTHYGSPSVPLRKDEASVADYFTGMKSYYENNWGNMVN